MTPLDMHGRHASARPAEPQGFTCPSCGAENFGPLSAGCSSCGAGKPGRKVGVEPPIRRAPEDQIQVGTNELPPAPVDVRFSSDMEAAFVAWKKQSSVPPALRESGEPGELVSLLFDAFRAGVVYGSTMTGRQDLPLSGTKESRTILAALKFFRDQIFSEHPEECQSGEWLTEDEMEALIARMERTQ